jgi:NADPH-dependent 7-cyano-7-deazaguanine reductase QueF
MLLFSFGVPQHFHADVNEALIKRFVCRFFPLWLRIGRTYRPRGSMEMTAGTGGVAAHQSQIRGIAKK